MYTPSQLKKPVKDYFMYNHKQYECYVIKVMGVEYQKCVEASMEYWANSKKGFYGSGIGKTEKDENKPVRTGLLGEMAFGKLCGTPVDLSYRKYGDKYDTTLNGKTIDIKCAMRNYGSILIYQKNEWGKIIPLDNNIYVAAYISEEDRKAGYAIVHIVGYATNRDVKKCPIKPARRGRHFNYEVSFDILKSLDKLLKNGK